MIIVIIIIVVTDIRHTLYIRIASPDTRRPLPRKPAFVSVRRPPHARRESHAHRRTISEYLHIIHTVCQP